MYILQKNKYFKSYLSNGPILIRYIEIYTFLNVSYIL